MTNLEGRDDAGNPLPEDPQRYCDWVVAQEAIGPVVIVAAWQGERGLPTQRRPNGLLHVQIMLQLHHHMRYATLNNHLHLERYQAKWLLVRSPPHAWDYCLKDDTRLPGAVPRTIGERPPDRYAKRKQTDEDRVDILVQAVENKTPFGAMWKGEHRGLMLRHWRTFLEIRNYLDQPGFQFIPKLLYYIEGGTGSDKTKNMWDFVRATNLPYWVSGGLMHGRYFTGYDQQPIMIFDEVRRFESVSILLQICDGRESVQEMKLSGARVVIRAKIIIFTSDRPIEQVKFQGSDPETGKDAWVPPTPEEVQQIRRRFCELPRLRPGVPNPWPNHPIGNILHYQNVQAFPNFVNRPLPLLSNAQRASLQLPLLSPAEEAVQFPHLYPQGAPEQYQENEELLAFRRDLQEINERAMQINLNEDFIVQNLLDDDMGLPEPRGVAV